MKLPSRRLARRSPGSRGRSPRLLVVVFLLSLGLVGVTAFALTTIVGDRIAQAAVHASVEADRALVSAFVETDMRPEDMGGLVSSERRAELQALISGLVRDSIAHIKMYRPDGTIELSENAALVGQNFGLGEHLAEAFAGHAEGEVEHGPFDEPDLASLGLPVVLEEYLPVFVGGSVPAVFEVYRDAAPILAQAAESRDQVFIVTLGASGVLALLLYFLFRTADRRLRTQTRRLVESTRRDALTGMLTHGAVVDRLVRALETAITGSGKLGLALVDIDNFRLLNESHGHAACDVVLKQVAHLLEGALPAGAICGRYGPDEFLVVAPDGAADELIPAVGRFREQLASLGPRFSGSERLPVTVSGGLCGFPGDGRSATELLSVAAVALSGARVSGGDQVRLAETGTARDDGQTERASFDVLQGLVIAVDTKDRYTKRHSEDVARYALFLADRLGAPPEWRRTLHIAGLLHDIGKIGIPDAILRKPAPLTADEYAIVKQHVALGFMIVRDLPYLDQVRAGIRFHHEQWDGTGYLEGLSGEQIPRVARILAVADAFSAMTTSRPYRKALTVTEALRRLEDASGTQLEATLVGAFVRGMETAPDAPMPGDDRVSLPRIWIPEALEPMTHAPSKAPLWLAPERQGRSGQPSGTAAGRA